jgi:hypothetical protein
LQQNCRGYAAVLAPISRSASLVERAELCEDTD